MCCGYAPGGTVAMVECLGLGVAKAVSTLPGEDLRLAIVQVLVDGAGEPHRWGRGTSPLASSSASIELEGRECRPVRSIRDDTSAMSLFMLSGAPCPWGTFGAAGVEMWLPAVMEGSAGGLYPAAAATGSSCSCGCVVPAGSSSAASVAFVAQPVLLPWSGSEELYGLGGWTSA